MKFRLLLLTFVFSTGVLIARANTTPDSDPLTKKFDIAGGVIHAGTKKPIINVSVTAYSVSKKEKVVVTDCNGNYSFTDLKPGTYKLIFEKDGFKKVIRDKVTIKSDDGFQLNIEMDQEEEFHIIPGQLMIDFG